MVLAEAQENTAPKRAAVRVTGLNHNFRYHGLTLHLQTEDHGFRRRFVSTHLFLGGSVVAASRTPYPEELDNTTPAGTLREFVRGCHLTMLYQLRDGEFDDQLPSSALPGSLGRRPRAQTADASTAPRPQTPESPDPSSEDPERAAALARLEQIKSEIDMANVNNSLKTLMNDVTGSLGAALVDHESGMALGTEGNGLNLEVACAGNMEVVRAKMRVMEALGIDGGIEDILITLETQYHIIRPVGSSLFMYLAFDRKTGNLAMARHKMASVANDLKV